MDATFHALRQTNEVTSSMGFGHWEEERVPAFFVHLEQHFIRLRLMLVCANTIPWSLQNQIVFVRSFFWDVQQKWTFHLRCIKGGRIFSISGDHRQRNLWQTHLQLFDPLICVRNIQFLRSAKCSACQGGNDIFLQLELTTQVASWLSLRGPLPERAWAQPWNIDWQTFFWFPKEKTFLFLNTRGVLRCLFGWFRWRKAASIHRPISGENRTLGMILGRSKPLPLNRESYIGDVSTRTMSPAFSLWATWSMRCSGAWSGASQQVRAMYRAVMSPVALIAHWHAVSRTLAASVGGRWWKVLHPYRPLDVSMWE